MYPIDAIRAAHEMGLLNLHIPKPTAARARLHGRSPRQRRIGVGRPGFATAAYATALATAPIITGATEAQKQVWLRKIAEEGHSRPMRSRSLERVPTWPPSPRRPPRR